nr:spore germination protein [Bacillus subtilis]
MFGSTLSSLSLAGTISTLRFFLFILSATLGIYGFFLGLFIVLSHLASLRSCGLPYLVPPISPPFKDLVPTLCFDYLGTMAKHSTGHVEDTRFYKARGQA